MSAGFTPGPWEVRWCKPLCKEEPYQLSARDGERILRWGAFIKPASDRAVANARLIAAAPELYEALHRAMLKFGSNMKAYDNDLYHAAYDALSKARGDA